MTRQITPLLPERHPTLDFFTCDIFDATPKSDMASMEYPLFSLATNPDFKSKEFRSADGTKWLKIAPSERGCATVNDRGILIYCISQLMAGLKAGRKAEQTLRFHAHDLMVVTNRDSSGTGYKRFQDALYRLSHTAIETNITSGGKDIWDTFSFIDHARVVKENRHGRMNEIEITLSKWVFNAINEKGGDLLTISRDYFRLRKPLELRLYEIARKQCGTKNKEWMRKISSLHTQMGSQSTLPEFRRMITRIVKDNIKTEHIPDYTFSISDDRLYIRPKPHFYQMYNKNSTTKPIDDILISTETFQKAKKLSGGWDIYMIEQHWKTMLKQKDSVPRSADGSFISYVKWYAEENGMAPRSSVSDDMFG